MVLHGITAADGESPIRVDDALKADPGLRFDMVLTNPPFGKKSSVTIVGENGESRRDDLTTVRDDFWATTSNKQLNFVQHVKTLLKIGGRAAVVVPDNVLFEGGAGERCGGNYCMSATCTRYCGSPRAFFMRKVSRPTYYSLTDVPLRKLRRRASFGSTTFAQTCTLRSRESR